MRDSSILNKVQWHWICLYDGRRVVIPIVCRAVETEIAFSMWVVAVSFVNGEEGSSTSVR
jgi:hypothetical protein